MKTRKTSKKINIVTVLILGAIISVSLFISSKMAADMTSNIESVYATGVVAKKGTIQATAEGSGKIISSNEQIVSFPYVTKVISVTHRRGDVVDKGDTIVQLESYELINAIADKEDAIREVEKEISNTSRSERAKITAIVSGSVKKVYAEIDIPLRETIEKYGSLMVICTDKKLKTEFQSSHKLKLGEEVEVTMGDYSATGRIESVNGKSYLVVYQDNSNFIYGENVSIKSEGKQLGIGPVECNLPYYVTGENGVVSSIPVNLNTSVKKGTTLFRIKNSVFSDKYSSLLKKRNLLIDELNELYLYKKRLKLTSDFHGVISGEEYKENSQFQPDTQFIKIKSDKSLIAEIEMDELDITNVNVGMQVNVFADAIPLKTYAGKVLRISQDAEDENITKYKVYVELADSNDLRIGYSVTGNIIVDEKKDVVVVPVELVYEENGNYYVDKVDPDNTITQCEVEVGLVNNAYAEIISGVSENDKIRKDVDIETSLNSFSLQ